MKNSVQDSKQSINPLTMESDAFNALKMDFNIVLRKTLATMQQKGAEKAELKVAVKISLAPDNELNQGGDDNREITVPEFAHKVTSVMQIKNEKSGTVGGEGWELLWDKDLGEYVLVKVKDAQQSLFDTDDEGDDYPSARYLPAPAPGAIEIIDVEDVEDVDEYDDDEDEADDEDEDEQ